MTIPLSTSPAPLSPPDFRAPISMALSEPLFLRLCAGIAALQVGLTACRLPGWPCLFFHATGLPCPGCGLTRSCVALLHGDLRASLRYHAFGPLLFVCIILCCIGAFLPRRTLAAAANHLRSLERRTALFYLLLTAFMIYWPLRLAGVFPLPA